MAANWRYGEAMPTVEVFSLRCVALECCLLTIYLNSMYLMKFTFSFIPEIEMYAGTDGMLTPNWDKATNYVNLFMFITAKVRYQFRFLFLTTHMRPVIERITILKLDIDTLTSAPARIVAGSLPIAYSVADNTTIHSVGQQITAYAGALIASAVVHLGLKLIDYLKKKYFKTNGDKTDQPIIEAKQP